jgi:hypothetical protein
MKRIAAIGMIVVLLLATVSCSGGAKVSQEEVDKAFVISFTSVLMASMGAAFGADMEGVTLNEETNEITLDGFDISEFETEYTSISGSARGDGTTMWVDVTLDGGAVNEIEYELTDFQGAESIETTVTVNGSEYEINLSPETLQM